MRRTTKFGACAGPGFDKQGFTLIELLTVVAILAVLSAIVVPTLSRARDKARAAMCSGTMRSLGLAINMYADDNQDVLPCPDDTFGDSAIWYYAINPYILRMKATNVQVVASQRMDLYKQDPIWSRALRPACNQARVGLFERPEPVVKSRDLNPLPRIFDRPT